MSTGSLPTTEQASVESELHHELYRSTRVAQVAFSQLSGLLPPGLDPAAAHLLAWLVKKGPARQGELAQSTMLDPSTISRRVGQLVRHGLVERAADPLDGRAVRLVATAAGRELLLRMRDARDAITRDLLADWPEGEVERLTGLLRRYNDAVDGFRRQPPSTTND
ncbi:MarR family winged helix-turn-helix transcriptional regulator [Spongisporangium articulatum]|uniref:MarR family winged helix-turn-helix transcriptional regulator n=1 Tax=Spongisporangium articulatum TaxID=3362603 RepID=A0ABW8AIY9_9ACTN